MKTVKRNSYTRKSLLLLAVLIISMSLGLAFAEEESSTGNATVTITIKFDPETNTLRSYLPNGEEILPFDVKNYSTYGQALDELGIMAGIEDSLGDRGTYDLEEPILREEFIALAVRTAVGFDMAWNDHDAEHIKYDVKWGYSDSPIFTDIPEHFWAEAYIRAAYNLELTNGVGGGKFGVGKEISSKNATYMIMKSIGLSVDYNEVENISSEQYGIDCGKSMGAKVLSYQDAFELVAKALMYKDESGQLVVEKNNFYETRMEQFIEIYEHIQLNDQ